MDGKNAFRDPYPDFDSNAAGPCLLVARVPEDPDALPPAEQRLYPALLSFWKDFRGDRCLLSPDTGAEGLDPRPDYAWRAGREANLGMLSLSRTKPYARIYFMGTEADRVLLPAAVMAATGRPDARRVLLADLCACASRASMDAAAHVLAALGTEISYGDPVRKGGAPDGL